MPSSLAKKKSTKKRDVVSSAMPFSGVVVDPVSVKKRKGFTITQEMREAYEQRDRSKGEPDAPVLSPDKWATAMRRAEFFRPIKKPTNVRIDADVLAWLKNKGEGHLTRINEILRAAMNAELRAGDKATRPHAGREEA